MAINQVIDGTDRVTEYSNRWKLNQVAGTSDTYDVEQVTGAIASIGTPYQASILNKIDNVLSYLQPNVEKVETGSEEKEGLYTISFADTSSTKSRRTEYINATNSSLKTGNFPTISYNIGGIYEGTSKNSWTNSSISNILNRATYDANYFITLVYSYNGYIEFDLKSKISGKINFYIQNCYIETSDDGNTWNNLVKCNGTAQTIDFNARYLRVKATNSYSSINIYYFNIYENYLDVKYQNQFTLDNNTTFVNNQRVLVETPIALPKYHDINKNWIIDSTNYKMTNADGVICESSDFILSSYSLKNISDGDSTTRVVYIGNIGDTKSIIFDLLEIKNIRYIDTYINSVVSAGNLVSIKISDDSINYNTIYEYTDTSAGSIRVDINDNARYIKIEMYFGTTSYSTSVYEFNINYKDISSTGMTTDGVTSNIINNIPCDTLLQPSTKYELIYNESDNKFETNVSMLDITLAEAVSEIALPTNFLKIGSNYVIMISGTMSTAGNVELIKGEIPAMTWLNIGYLNTTNSFATSYLSISNNGLSSISNTSISAIGYSSKPNDTMYDVFDSNMKITTNSSSKTFGAGTRIIIKEVA